MYIYHSYLFEGRLPMFLNKAIYNVAFHKRYILKLNKCIASALDNYKET